METFFSKRLLDRDHFHHHHLCKQLVYNLLPIVSVYLQILPKLHFFTKILCAPIPRMSMIIFHTEVTIAIKSCCIFKCFM